MQREFRYLVVKYKDMLRYMSEEEQMAFIELVKKIETGRERDGRGQLECVCVESDWPEYLDTWSAIAARVDNVPLYKAKMQQYQNYVVDLRSAIDQAQPNKGEE